MISTSKEEVREAFSKPREEKTLPDLDLKYVGTIAEGQNIGFSLIAFDNVNNRIESIKSLRRFLAASKFRSTHDGLRECKEAIDKVTGVNRITTSGKAERFDFTAGGFLPSQFEAFVHEMESYGIAVYVRAISIRPDLLSDSKGTK